MALRIYRNVTLGALLLTAASAVRSEDRLILAGLHGQPGTGIVYSERTAPKTFNPVVAADSASRDIVNRMMADLVHINRVTLQTEPALAKSCRISGDGLRYEVDLRQGLRFSDGQPFTADDVIFTFEVYLDEKVGSPQRNLWILDGKPVRVRKLGPYRVVFELPRVNAVGERVFDGVPMLPRHMLERPYREGKLAEAWGLRTPPAEIAGLGPFRLKQYVAGQRVILERNPYYWKSDAAGNVLPYLHELDFELAGNEDLQVMRFESGEADLVSRISARNYSELHQQAAQHGYVVRDAGPGFEYSFLVFNLNGGATGRPQVWRRLAFRRAVSAAIDRQAIVRLVYAGFAAPLGSPVAAGNKPWIDAKLPVPVRSTESARKTLAEDGFRWSREGALLDGDGRPVEFSIIAGNSNPERMQMATLIQADLQEVGIRVNIVPLDFASLVDRLTRTHDYEACISALGSADADPSADLNVWLSSGATHLWNPGQKTPATPWEGEIDRLMREQMVTRDYPARKRLFDRVQEILAENLPLIPLATPHILVGAKAALGNFQPAALDPYGIWNVDQLYWRNTGGRPPGR